ncbi:acyltransferase [Candidatus Desantisbacteria bacterium]|nr:acyltransferase [Candidatus Desantisbacteria bacterium]
MQKISEKHINGLDGLRGLACLAVFGVHFEQITKIDGQLGLLSVSRLLENGNTGVAMFFLLSGFLLGLPYWRMKQEEGRKPGFGGYWIRRLARIIPSYFVCLTGLILINHHGDLQNNDILLHYLFLFNCTEYSIYSINPPFWSIAVIVQFYLVLPMVFLLVSRLRSFQTFFIILLLSCGAYGVHFWLIHFTGSLTNWPISVDVIRTYGNVLQKSLLAHLPHFLLGTALGWLFLRLKHHEMEFSFRIRIVSEFAFWVSVVLTIVILGTPLDNWCTVPYGRYNYPFIPLLLAIIIVSVPFSELARRLLDSFPIRGLGIISYGIYIYHLPIQHVTDKYMQKTGMNAGENWILFGMISLILSILIASLSYIAIESPILRISKRIIQ